MSSAAKAFGVIKTIMLMNERFDRLEEKNKDLALDLGALGRSHAELAERVAKIEGYIRGRADQASVQTKLPGPD